jgi:hypothetical protein
VRQLQERQGQGHQLQERQERLARLPGREPPVLPQEPGLVPVQEPGPAQQEPGRELALQELVLACHRR